MTLPVPRSPISGIRRSTGAACSSRPRRRSARRPSRRLADEQAGKRAGERVGGESSDFAPYIVCERLNLIRVGIAGTQEIAPDAVLQSFLPLLQRTLVERQRLGVFSDSVMDNPQAAEQEGRRARKRIDCAGAKTLPGHRHRRLPVYRPDVP